MFRGEKTPFRAESAIVVKSGRAKMVGYVSPTGQNVAPAFTV
jgi:hypothetical protein